MEKEKIEKIKDPKEELFNIMETGRYNVYYRFKPVSFLEMSKVVEQYRPSAFINQKSADFERLLNMIYYDKEFNRVVSFALKTHSIDWENIRKKIERYYEAHGKDWILFCYRNKRKCFQLAILGETELPENIIVNIYIY